jgi:hypothetical protein
MGSRPPTFKIAADAGRLGRVSLGIVILVRDRFVLAVVKVDSPASEYAGDALIGAPRSLQRPRVLQPSTSGRSRKDSNPNWDRKPGVVT